MRDDSVRHASEFAPTSVISNTHLYPNTTHVPFPYIRQVLSEDLANLNKSVYHCTNYCFFNAKYCFRRRDLISVGFFGVFFGRGAYGAVSA